jgi:tetratricopeptide (TPR) repeat protein
MSENRKEESLLISPLCVEGNVDTYSVRGLLDILAMHLHICNINVKAPLFVVNVDNENPKIQQELLTWPVQYDPEELFYLASQWEVDYVLVPIVREEAKDSFSLELKLFHGAGEYAACDLSWSGSLLKIAHGVSIAWWDIASCLTPDASCPHTLWPATQNEKALRLLLQGITFMNLFHAGLYPDFRAILNSFWHILQLEPLLELAAYRLIGFIESLIHDGTWEADTYLAAIESLRKIEKYQNLSGTLHTLIANIYEMRGDVASAKRNLEIALAKAPDNEDVVMSVGNYYENQEQWHKARLVYENYLRQPQSAPSSPVLHNLGSIWAEQGNLQKAIQRWCEALKVNPHYGPAYGNLMNAYCETKEYGKMWVVLEESLKHEPIFWHSYEHLIENLHKPQDLSALASILKEYLVHYSENPAPYFFLGLAFLKQHNIQKALKALEMGLKVKEENIEFRTHIAQEILSIKIKKFDKLFTQAGEEAFEGNPQKAIGFLQKCISITHDFWPAWFFLGKAYERLEESQESLQAFEEAKRLVPDNPILWNELGLAATFSGDDQYALSCFQKCTSLSPLNVNYLSNLALTFVKLGDPAKAKAILGRALAISPHNEISKNIKAILDGEAILHPDGSITPAKKNRRKGKHRKPKNQWYV